MLIDCALAAVEGRDCRSRGPGGNAGPTAKSCGSARRSKDRTGEIGGRPAQAHWVLRVDEGKLGLVEACGNRAPFALPPPDSPALARALRQSIEKIYRARNLVAVSSRFESERSRGASAVDIELQVLRHKNQADQGQVEPAPPGGWVFRPGDQISFGVHNKTESMRLDVTLLGHRLRF